MIEIGHIYINDYPESAAEWCNTNNAYIEEIEPQNGHRRFEVKAVPATSFFVNFCSIKKTAFVRTVFGTIYTTKFFFTVSAYWHD